MTFGTWVKTLRADIPIFIHFSAGGHPNDFQIFVALKQHNNRRLLSSIPAVSTHGETQWLSPFINWEEEFKRTLDMLPSE